jgi:hypothetical protein
LPQWIGILFLIVIPIPVILIALLARKGAPSEKKKIVFYSIIGFFVLYFTYLTIGSLQGLFNKVFFPPIILLFSTFPLKIFLFTVVINWAIYKTILQNTSLQDLVKVHIFRLIGVFFLILAYHNTLPKTFAIIAGLGDMLTAITSIFIAKAIQNKKSYTKKLVFFWNTFGLLDIIYTAISAIVLTKISIDTGAMGVDTLARFPLCFIPAFAPPTIIFLHVAIYKKLKQSDH